jgi:hypothetical protein
MNAFSQIQKRNVQQKVHRTKKIVDHDTKVAAIHAIDEQMKKLHNDKKKLGRVQSGKCTSASKGNNWMPSVDLEDAEVSLPSLSMPSLPSHHSLGQTTSCYFVASANPLPFQSPGT